MIPKRQSSSKVQYDLNATLGIHHWGPKRQLFYRARHAFGYGYLKEIVVRRANQKEYVFNEVDFTGLHLNDIEDMFLLYLQNKLHHLKGDEQVDLVNALRHFTRRTVIKKKVEDVQLGVESYQPKLNITMPQITCDGLEVKEPYTILYKPRGVVNMNKINRKILMRDDEL
ncbi:hypothetical protein Tco_1360490 [Tanacetum coccineum]